MFLELKGRGLLQAHWRDRFVPPRALKTCRSILNQAAPEGLIATQLIAHAALPLNISAKATQAQDSLIDPLPVKHPTDIMFIRKAMSRGGVDYAMPY